MGLTPALVRHTMSMLFLQLLAHVYLFILGLGRPGLGQGLTIVSVQMLPLQT